MIVAIASRVEQNALKLLPPELKTLLGRRPTISLPAFSKTEALEFVTERLSFFRPPEFSGSSTAPFSKDGVEVIVDFVAKNDHATLIPREILQVLADVYDDTFDEENGLIDAAQAITSLEGLGYTQ